MTTTPAIAVRNLTKRYGGLKVLDHVSLDVAAGEIVGLLGRNGAGKTTTAECITGLRRADEGSIRILGLDPQVDGDRLRGLVGSPLQESALPDRIKVGEAIELFRGPEAADVDTLLGAYGLDAQRRTSFAALSGGQRQRLFLVLALLNRPKLVVLDELTQGLDPAARRDVWDAIMTLRASGTTVLLVTHFMEEAEVLCDRVVVLDRGRVLDSGSPAELLDRNAPWAKVRFSASEAQLPALRTIAGVTSVRRDGAVVEVHGDRSMVARVCAHLVASGAPPTDLFVAMPTLEDAVLSLLTSHPRGPQLGEVA